MRVNPHPFADSLPASCGLPGSGGLSIRFHEPVQVVRATVKRATRAVIAFYTHASPFQEFSRDIRLGFSFLDEGDGALVEVLHTGAESEDIEIAGTIIGCPKGVVRAETDLDPSALTWPQEWLRWHKSLPRKTLLRLALPLSVFAPLAVCASVSLTLPSLKELDRQSQVMLLLWPSVLLWVVIWASVLLVLPLLKWGTLRKLSIGPASCPLALLLDMSPGQPRGEEPPAAEVTPRAVILPRRTAWRPVAGAEYIWARMLPTPEEARKGCAVTLVRPFELRADPQSATLSLRVDDEADVVINSHCVAAGPMDRAGILPEHNPSGVAYRLDVTY